MPRPDSWDLEQVYDEKISPLMSQIIAICKEHQLPMLAAFQYAKQGEAESFCVTHLPFEGSSRNLPAAARLIRQGYLAYMVTKR